jgi:hypothetical protein
VPRTRVVGALRAAYLRSGIRKVAPQRLKDGGRRTWVRLAHRAGYPISSLYLPRPALVPGRAPLRVTHALVASDLNPRYLEAWELVSRAWPTIVGIEPRLVLVAAEQDVPAALRDDERVTLFEPLPDVPTPFQAQCIRLLQPALLEVDGAVVISDMELVPLDPGFFHVHAGRLDDRFFLAYRDVLFPKDQMAMAYNAATPAVWGEIFGVSTSAEVRARLAEWARGLEYDGVRGGAGWYTDQVLLRDHLVAWARRTGRLWMLDDDHTGFTRLDRVVLGGGELPARARRNLERGRYTDFDSLVPHSRYRAINDAVVEIAARRSSGAPRS